MNPEATIQRADRLSWLGLRGTQIRMDSAYRKMGVYSETSPLHTISAAQEMGAFAITKDDHLSHPDIKPYFGACADYDPSDLADRDDVTVVVMALANPETMTSAARAQLAAFGLYYDGSSGPKTLVSWDTLFFVGQNGLPAGCGYEVRLNLAEDLACAVHLLGAHITNPRFLSTI